MTLINRCTDLQQIIGTTLLLYLSHQSITVHCETYAFHSLGHLYRKLVFWPFYAMRNRPIDIKFFSSIYLQRSV